MLAITMAAVALMAQARPDTLQTMSASLERLAQKASPAVVEIIVTGYGSLSERVKEGGFVRTQRGAGSGVIVDPSGYIVTNGHVVEGARRVAVVLPQMAAPGQPHHSVVRPIGRRVSAKVVGIDRDTDLAVLKIDETNLPTLAFEDSEQVRQGQLVVALGSPLGLADSLSLGIVSAVARQLKPDDSMIYIQTDAPINPGNSGGPLLDSECRVVGINTMIFTQSGGSEGIGFAIPSNIVKNVVDQIRAKGKVTRSQIGVRVQSVTPSLAEHLALPRNWGALVADVKDSSAAKIAGVEIGDLIVGLDGKPIENARQFQVNLFNRPPGSQVKLTLLRGKEEIERAVAVLERDNEPDKLADLLEGNAEAIPHLGLLGIPLEGAATKLVGGARKLNGVVVAAITNRFRLETFMIGDIIYSVNKEPVRTPEELAAKLRPMNAGDVVVLQMERDHKLLFVPVELD